MLNPIECLHFNFNKEFILTKQQPTFRSDLEDIATAIKNYISGSDIRIKVNNTEFQKDSKNNIELNITKENTKTNVKISNQGKISVDQQLVEQQEIP